jgi:hypothetical protein
VLWEYRIFHVALMNIHRDDFAKVILVGFCILFRSFLTSSKGGESGGKLGIRISDRGDFWA